MARTDCNIWCTNRGEGGGAGTRMFLSYRLLAIRDEMRRDDFRRGGLLLMERETANRVRFVAAGIVGLSIIVRYSLRLYTLRNISMLSS